MKGETTGDIRFVDSGTTVPEIIKIEAGFGEECDICLSTTRTVKVLGKKSELNICDRCARELAEFLSHGEPKVKAKPAVKRRLPRRNGKVRRPRWTEHEVEWLKRLRGEGKSPKNIAKTLHRTKSSIGNKLFELSKAE